MLECYLKYNNSSVYMHSTQHLPLNISFNNRMKTALLLQYSVVETSVARRIMTFNISFQQPQILLFLIEKHFIHLTSKMKFFVNYRLLQCNNYGKKMNLNE